MSMRRRRSPPFGGRGEGGRRGRADDGAADRGGAPVVPGGGGGDGRWPEKAVGVVRRLGAIAYLDSAAAGLPGWVPLEGADVERLAEETLCEAALVPPPPGSPRQAAPTARLLRVLGVPADPAMEVARILAERGIERDFPADAISQAAEYPDEPDGDREIAASGGRREDLRSLPFVTIDGADAKDFDDAVACEDRPGGGWRLYVGIADVAAYVTGGSPLDVAARGRGTSVYLPGVCVPMLPEKLSNGLCSLKPDVDRLAMVAVMEFDADGAPRSDGQVRVTDAVIRSRARLTYEQAQAALDGDSQAAGPRAFARREDLGRMAALAKVLNGRRVAAGAIDLDLPEPQVLFGEADTIDVIPRGRLQTHRLIEEFMLAANMAVGRVFNGPGEDLPCVWRVHPPPDPDRVEQLGRAGAAYGLSLPRRKGGAALSPGDLAAFLRSAEGTPATAALHYMGLRTLSRAEYSIDDVGHFGLGVKGYLHFTSPIRRYPDLLVHRGLKEILGGRRRARPGEHAEVGDAARSSSELERRAMDAEYEALDLYRALAMRDRVGEEFDATVTTVTSFGVFAQIGRPFVEGLLHISDIGDDWFRHDEERMALVGERSGRSVRLGDRLRVRISEVDIGKRRITFRSAPPRA